MRTRSGAPAVSTAPPVVSETIKSPLRPKLAGRKNLPLVIPPILLEGDHPETGPAGDVAHRFDLTPEPPAQEFAEEESPGVLPKSYGTRQLMLAARDPHWLYAHWDLDQRERKQFNATSRDGHLMLRVYADASPGEPVTIARVHPESSHWFLHVGRGGASYRAELGFFRDDGSWQQVSRSATVSTPPDMISSETGATFATIPYDLPLAQLGEMVKAASQADSRLADELEALRASGHPALPARPLPAPSDWTPDQVAALAEVLARDSLQRVWVGSHEVTNLIERHLLSSKAASQFSLPSSPAGEGVSSRLFSPSGGMPGAKGFWFNVNAELVVYGATEPGSRVTIGDRPIALRPDGSFSFRFALPDGDHELPVVAVAPGGDDSRKAGLKFCRRTNYNGQVDAHPQDPAWKPPHPDHLE